MEMLVWDSPAHMFLCEFGLVCEAQFVIGYDTSPRKNDIYFVRFHQVCIV